MAVCGTRPEVVKLSPVIKALRARGHRVVLVATGQHADLAPRMLSEFGLVPDAQLSSGPAGLRPAQVLGSLLTRLPPLVAAWRPSLLLVQGDTISALAGALAGNYARVPVAHVEAGLRTGDQDEPHPEEMQRQLIAPLASLHFAPSRRAAEALGREGVPAEHVHVVGNSGIDALFATRDRLAGDRRLQARLAARYPFAAQPGRPLLLATVHRRENQGPRLLAIAAALAHLAAFDGLRVALPLHPNPAVHRVLRQQLQGLENAHLMEPLEHVAMVWMMQRAHLLLTDSGGLQEEAPSLGLRTLVLRERTERPEAIDAGASELVPLQSGRIVAAAKRLLAMAPLQPVHPFGDGRTGESIAAAIERWLGVRQPLPETVAAPA
nr:UDP-N-acetylglucosamine 2-epimerase (non-hydrolyzing) [Sandaracinobacteroides sayramensis]